MKRLLGPHPLDQPGQECSHPLEARAAVGSWSMGILQTGEPIGGVGTLYVICVKCGVYEEGERYKPPEPPQGG